MATRIEPVQLNERSPRAANLLAALRALGLHVDPQEAADGRAGEATAKLLRELQTRFGIPAPREGMVVDETGAGLLNRQLAVAGVLDPDTLAFLVRGVVRDAGSQPVPGLTVNAYDQDLRRQELLGQAMTDAGGEYVIEYAPQRFRVGERATADLAIEVFSPAKELLFRSEIVFNAPRRATIDVTLARRDPMAEFERIALQIAPILEGQEVKLKDLEETKEHADLTFLACETGIEPGRLMQYLAAYHLAATKHLPAEFWFAVLRMRGIATDVPAGDPTLTVAAYTSQIVANLPSASLGGIRTALQRAMAENVIRTYEDATPAEWLRIFGELLGGDELAAQNRIADLAELSGKKRLLLVEIILAGGTRTDIIERLRASALNAREIGRVEVLLTLQDLVFGDNKLLEALAKQVKDVGSLRELARYHPEEWQQLLAKLKVPAPSFLAGDDAESMQGNYAALLSQTFALAYPSASFAGALSRSVSAKDAKPPLAAAKSIATFLDAHPEFDLGRVSVEGFVRRHAKREAVPRGSEAETATFISELKAAQRVFKLAPEFDAARSLLEEGVHSAQQIYRMGESRFVRTFKERAGFDESRARETFQRASNTVAAVLTIVGELRATQNAGDVAALSGGTALADFPNLARLFGSADVCECDDCNSIFSPSAYFADILTFLSHRHARAAGVFVDDVLIRRREDLPYIELTCENSHTPLPYVDLACEVLEDRVAPWKLFDLNPALEPLLAAGAVPAAVVADFAAANVPLSATARLSDHDARQSWIIHDGKTTYRVAKRGAILEVSLLRQTRGTAAELAAAPEYLNLAAYQKLQAQTYPLALPFDLSTEELRAYLLRAGTSRAEVMEVFRGAAVPDDLDIGSEVIGISWYEYDPIFGVAPPNPPQHYQWGETSDADAVAAMTTVGTFLDRTGLEYNDLLTLLSLRYINDGSIVVHHLDATCDTSQKALQVLDNDALDRIHRFLRLWRKLGWKMWEVDLIVRHPAIGNGVIDRNLPVRLRPFLALKEALPSFTVDQLAALFDSINTTAHFTKAFGRPDPSLYERLFLNKRLVNPVDAAFTLDALSTLPSAAIDAHIAPILAATRLSPSDLALLRTATGINADLTLANLSTLYRHALLARALRIKPRDWRLLLFIENRDIFQSPSVTLEFIRDVEQIRAAGWSVEQLYYLVTGEPASTAAESERVKTMFLTTLRKALQSIAATYAASSLPSSEEESASKITAFLQTIGWDTAAAQSAVDAITGTLQVHATAATLAPAFAFPKVVRDAMPVTFAADTRTITFTGVMSDAQRTTLLDPAVIDPAAVADALYQAAIGEIHAVPRLLMKLYRPSFRVALGTLPPNIDFAAQLSAPLSTKVSYDAERRELRFNGIMSTDERAALDALSNTPAYTAAVATLFNRPMGVFGADELWLAPADLAFPLAANVQANLGIAITRLAAYLTRTLTVETAIQQLAAALRLPPAGIERLITTFQLAGETHLARLTRPAFIASSGAVTPAAQPDQYLSYDWLHRASVLLHTLKMTLPDLDWMIRRRADCHLPDLSLFVPFVAGNPPAPLATLLNLAGFMSFHHDHTAPDMTLLDVIDRLASVPGYANVQFAADVETLTAWPAEDTKRLTDPAGLDLAYPPAYLEYAAWRRLQRVFRILARINASADAALSLAKPVVTGAHAALAKQLLRGKSEESDWLEVSQSIQDGLRERKRDALVAYLLTQPMPPDAPSGKWTSPEDLYAYNLIDVQMCSCQLTSRIVQASAAAQLFVQRCFMGLEPTVRVSIEEDSDWAQWDWMKQYRVWEANRRVFAYPENYALPELRRDRSEIMKSLDDELLQNEVNRDNAESAFLHYVERLDDVAQLEIAGTYYQDNINTLHVFAHSAGGDPRVLYYRKFIDGRRWTAWSKVDADIKADYVVPLVANERLHLVWPEFREEPEPTTHATVPKAETPNSPVDQPEKRMNVFLAVSELRNKKWTPKRVTAEPVRSSTYTTAFDETGVKVVPLDLTFMDGPFLLFINSPYHHDLYELAGCRGYPEPYQQYAAYVPVLRRFERETMRSLRNVENDDGDPLVPSTGWSSHEPILGLTPDRFRINYPQYLSAFDRMILTLRFGLKAVSAAVTKDRWLHSQKSRQEYIPLTVGTFYDWFYADKLRTFHVRPLLFSGDRQPPLYYEDLVPRLAELEKLFAVSKYEQLSRFSRRFLKAYRSGFVFYNFYHPLTCLFAKQLYAKGVDGLMTRETQFADKNFDFRATYAPTPIVDHRYPIEAVDFTPAGSYSIYNWEIFYFAPLSIAIRLSLNQRFEEAMHWFQYIFDPTGGHDRDPRTGAPAGTPQKYWITQPFFEQTDEAYKQQRIENLMLLLANDPAHPTDPTLLNELRHQVQDWRRNPFDPHVVANYRQVAYQKLTVMKYIDNLIAWGDQRFRSETLESINEATQLYVLAAEILGPRPRRVPPAGKPVPRTFSELEAELDAFTNAVIDFENLIPQMPPSDAGPAPPPLPNLLYFCIPQNDQLLAYWDTVADRLYKIRHCLDIEGVARQLALFAPPIDPLALVRATAGGASLASALAALDAPIPFYRFATMLQKANELANDVKSLGSALLSALEKKDAEAMAVLRHDHERAVLDAVRMVKQKQVEDANLSVDSLRKNIEMVSLRRDFYSSRTFMNAAETLSAGLSGGSLALDAGIAIGYILSGGLKLVPNFLIGAAGFGGSPTADVGTGGSSFGNSAEDAVKTMSAIATALDKGANLASTIGSHQRRMDDWRHQAALARKELEQLDVQLRAAQLKADIAQKELDNHDLQIKNAKGVADFMHDKYTNEELFQWMMGQISQTHFQSYQLAYDLAKRAERCYQFELGVTGSSFVQFGYWDSLRKGLLAGERLQLDLRRLESAYLDQNRRELEITKHVSLALLDPIALLELKSKGVCTVRVPEELFDLDYPGHYFRRIKTVGISIPCIAGPHTTINCTLRLLKNSIRINSSPAPQYERNNEDGVPADDVRFRESNIRVKSIATSTGQNDSGMFELNFRDERYLPFEGAGAISTWQIELSKAPELRQFSYDSISDVILHIRYAARADEGTFKTQAVDYLKRVIADGSAQLPLLRIFDLKREFPTEWYSFFHPAAGGAKVMSLPVTGDHFPWFTRGRAIEINAVTLAVRSNVTTKLFAQIEPPLPQVSGHPDEIDLGTTGSANFFHEGTRGDLTEPFDPTQRWQLRLKKIGETYDAITEAGVEEAFLITTYTL